MSDNSMVTLNHAIAVTMVRDPLAGLELLAQLDMDERMARHYRLMQFVRIYMRWPVIDKQRSSIT